MPSGDSSVTSNRASGYSLVMVVMLITVMNIVVAIALPLWTGLIQRDKEEELISRGMQYAEAIRVFQLRFGRLPVQLDELVKVEPRSIRRLWEDPMTGKADWLLIIEGAPPGTPGGPPAIDPNTGLPLPGPQTPPGAGEDEKPPQPVGPIRGVRSRASGDAFHVFLDQEDYGSWEFRSDIFSRFRAAPSENGIPRVSALTIGRPFRYENPGAAPPGSGMGLPSAPPGVPGSPPPGKPRLRSQGATPPPGGKP
jgi:type II secretory pathway pseudopilin PulG